ncbi:chromate resistance protein ChrB domain-containing protein [Lentzea kentuckyensis]|uniref:chromate resistance protein ChrB domain-containing protein n=1 Tax=Lentzea kentuckyensis TaxID=360086 RepID=UPI001FE5F04C|nr:chromate resistance protein ChrB domain-containing protein [Lentzea kentuckyensis]
MKRATRAGIHIDRAACAWLIRRTVHADAEFVFVTDPAQVPADATPFDMRGVELGHHGGDCSFETILRRYDITDPVQWRIAEIIHEADVDDVTAAPWLFLKDRVHPTADVRARQPSPGSASRREHQRTVFVRTSGSCSRALPASASSHPSAQPTGRSQHDRCR